MHVVCMSDCACVAMHVCWFLINAIGDDDDDDYDDDDDDDNVAVDGESCGTCEIDEDSGDSNNTDMMAMMSTMIVKLAVVVITDDSDQDFGYSMVIVRRQSM